FQQQSIDPARRERTAAIGLSLIPGLGHAYLGFMNRGIVFLSGAAALLFGSLLAAILLHEEVFLIGWAGLPMLMALAMSDASNLLRRRENGELHLDSWFSAMPGGKHPAVASVCSL